MFEKVMFGILAVLVTGGLVLEICWGRNLIRQTLRDEEMMEAFRVFGRLIISPFRSMGATLGQPFNTLVDTAQVVLWPKRKKEEKKDVLG